ncbi:peptidoglycan/LPS O-acetylase OafA/YrhL [Bradyrhizobium sp. GM6.1]
MQPVSRAAAHFRADVEGLRAIAVLSVVAFHYGVPSVTGGFVGVDVFFVISGYLISQLLLREIAATGKLDFLGFYGRRAKRLLPAALAVTVATLTIGYFVLAPFEQKEMAKSATASALYAANVWLLRQSTNYFAPESSLNPFLHTWSLSVEEQFYLFWPAFLLLVGRISQKVLLIALLIVVFGSFAACFYLTYGKQAWAFYLAPPRAWEFGLGALIATRPFEDWMRQPGSSRLIVGWLSFAVLILSFFAIDGFMPFPGVVAMVPVFATALLLLTGDDPAGPSALLRMRPFQFFDARSYAIYLWHWPIAVLGTVLVGGTALAHCLFFAMTVVLSSLSFAWLERPIRSSYWLAQRSVRSIAMGGALTLIATVAGVLSFTIAQYVTDAAQAAIVASTSKFSLASESGCLAGFTTPKPIRCVFGPSNYTKTIVLLGDSHADQWTTALTAIAEQKGWRLITYLRASCPVADISISKVYSLRLRRLSSQCASWREQAIAKIKNQDTPDAILLAQFSSGNVKGPFTNLGPHAVSVETWERGLFRALKELEPLGVKLIVLRDNPTPYHPVGNCLARAEWRGLPFSTCSRSLSLTMSDEVFEAEQRVVSSINNARMIDLTSSICTDLVCPAIRDGIVVYRDANHLTVDFTLLLKDRLAADLTAAL